jgi:peptide/nickel transport system substrate-binding protein
MNLGSPAKSYGGMYDTLANKPCIESLVDLGEKGEIKPWLSTDWQFSANYSSCTFHIRKGVKFHDGTDLNADAVKYSLDLTKNSAYAAELAGISSIDIVDDYTIKMNFKQYDPSLLVALTTRRGMIVSKTALLKDGEDYAMLHPVGTGPFKFTSYTKDVSLKYEKFNDYWQKGKPYLDGIEMVLIADQVTRLMAFKAGETQATMRVLAQDALDIQKQGLKNISFANKPGGVIAVACDSGNPSSPFSNLKVRQAVAYSIDTDTMAKSLGGGFYEVSNQLFHKSTFPYNSAVVGYPYNPQKAKELLTQAGYSNGFKTSIIYTEEGGTGDRMAIIQGYLKVVGIDVAIQAYDRGKFTDLQNNGWQNAIVHWGPRGGVESEPATTITSSLSKTMNQYKNIDIPADYQAKVEQAVKELDQQKRVALFQELSVMITDKYCMIFPLFYGVGISAFDGNKVHDWMTEFQTIYWRAENTWLSK